MLMTTTAQPQTIAFIDSQNPYDRSRTYYWRGTVSEYPQNPLQPLFTEVVGDIEGVDSVTRKAHEVTVTLARAYDWNEVHDAIVAAIAARLPKVAD